MPDAFGVERVKIDGFMLADAAQECGGKLNIIGGGWNILYPTGPGIPIVTIALAMRVIVPWSETNRPLHFEVELIGPDGAGASHAILRVDLNLGRPPTLPPGTEQAAPLAFTLAGLTFDREGPHTFRVIHEDEEVATARFLVQFRPNA